MPKTAIIKLRIDEEQKQRWQKRAEESGCSLSEYVRGMVDRGQARTDAMRIKFEKERHAK